MSKSFQNELNEIAEKVQASNRRRYKFILTGTISSLRHHKDSCISSSLSVDVRHSDSSWKELFNQISLEERSKFEEETLSNLDGIKRKKIYSKKTDGSKNEYIVVAILVVADGTLKLPEAIRSTEELEAVMQMLNSIPETQLRGVRVFWTPQDKDDVLLEERTTFFWKRGYPCFSA